MITKWKVGDTIQGRYKVDQIKEGGMSRVYLVHDISEEEQLARFSSAVFTGDFTFPFSVELADAMRRYLNENLRMAIKVPKALEQAILRRFEREIMTWIRLGRHRHIVRACGLERLHNLPILFLERVQGHSLREWIERRNLDTPRSLDFAVQICQALAYAHKSLNLVHRDLKPENILITELHLARVTDFGLAKSTALTTSTIDGAPLFDSTVQLRPGEARMTAAGCVLGTLPYMAPEQFTRPEAVDFAADIYAFGVVLYEMLSGQQPMEITHALSLKEAIAMYRMMHQEQQPRPLTEIAPSMPRELSEVVMRCLAKDKHDRFHSWDAVLDSLITLNQELRIRDERSGKIMSPSEIILEREGADARYRSGDPPPETPTLDDWLRTGFMLRDIREFALARQVFEDGIAQLEQLLEGKRSLPWPQSVRYERKGRNIIVEGATPSEIRGVIVEMKVGRAFCMDEMGDTQGALKMVEALLQVDPEYARAWITKSLLLKNLGQYHEAVLCCDRAIQIDPENVDAWHNKGNSLGLCGRYEEALACFEQALRIDPYYEPARQGKNQCLRALGHQRMAEHINRAAAHMEMQRYHEALADLNQAIRFDPNNAVAFYNRGVTYTTLQRYDEAMADYKRAIQLDPTFIQAYINLGILLAQQDALREALPYFERAAQLGHPQGAQYAAQARQMLGMESAPQVNPAQLAFEAFQEAISLDELERAVVKFPFMTDADFIVAAEQAIVQQVPPELQPALEQRLAWLRQIANEQEREERNQ